ncbi:MAG: glycosyltransferase [Bacteroidetes bacterium]|nr:glycosyltransferase [Bacteroidota bacterium]
MELSIAILVYQFSPLKVIQELAEQSRKLQINFEIVVYDDGSGAVWQEQLKRDLTDIPEVFLELASQNLGRSAARNRLAQKLLGKFVLMIDGDNPIQAPHFVNDYYQVRKANTVVVGGRYVDEQALPGCELRWAFAQNREVKNLKERLGNPYAHFQTNCFLADREVFNKVRFEEDLRSYGYEDSLFGFDLKNAGISVLHIENPQFHKADDRNARFLAKSEEAMESLYWIYSKRPHLRAEFKLIRILTQVQKLRMRRLCFWALSLMRPGLIENLSSNGPSLWRFDLFRLHRLLAIDLGQ